ncbi:MAG: cell division protein SepF [Candidatus Methanospirare jalkutatii]|nr:cell division protein SepF [Candidatus Methanospirare jalkutatii]
MSLKGKLKAFFYGSYGGGAARKRNTSNNEEYVDLDLEEYETELREEEGVKMFVKIAELTGLYDVPELKREIYAGNMLILDVSLAKHDKVSLEKAIKDLKRVAMDVNGDIAGIGDNQIIVTPTGVKIERKKMKSSG